MRIPHKLKIGGMTYSVTRNYCFKESELMGQASHSQTDIRLCKKDTMGNPYPRQKIEETLMHEIVHSIDCIYNNNKLEEETVNRLSQGLYQVFNDNKLFNETKGETMTQLKPVKNVPTKGKKRSASVSKQVKSDMIRKR